MRVVHYLLKCERNNQSQKW